LIKPKILPLSGETVAASSELIHIISAEEWGYAKQFLWTKRKPFAVNVTQRRALRALNW
jgi:hypothetical protein